MNLSRVAAKQLTASDLSLFASVFHKSAQKSKQKGINLNGDVFVDAFYPGLRDRMDVVRFGLTILGPGNSPAYTGLSRKALNENKKNWRLNGELLSDPPDEPGRFAQLEPNDIAILAFEGDSQPEQVTMLLVSATADTRLHQSLKALCGFHGRETMKQLTEDHLRQLVSATAADYEPAHPIEAFLNADSIEDALYGSATSQELVVKGDGRGRLVSSEAVQRQAQAAGETGQEGERCFRDWLLANGHSEDDFEWVARDYARSAYDFALARNSWEKDSTHIFVDVKSTRGPHGSPIHMSYAELRWAAQHSNYRIARVSQLTPSSAEIVILGGVTEVAKKTLDVIGGMPAGVCLTSVQISPELLAVVHRSRYEEGVESEQVR